jgi:hypothetical protein
MTFFRRFPDNELLLLGPEIQKIVEGTIPENIQLSNSAKRMAQISKELTLEGKTSEKEVDLADFNRDEMVRAIALTLKSWVHRRDKPLQRKNAHELYKNLFGRDYNWINASLDEESDHINRLLKESVLQENLVAKIPELKTMFMVLGKLQNKFEDIAKGSLEKECDTSEKRKLRSEFHSEIDLYLAMIDKQYKAYLPQQYEIRKKLLNPLIESTDRLN